MLKTRRAAYGAQVHDSTYLNINASCKNGVSICGSSNCHDISLVLAESLQQGAVLAVPELHRAPAVAADHRAIRQHQD